MISVTQRSSAAPGMPPKTRRGTPLDPRAFQRSPNVASGLYLMDSHHRYQGLASYLIIEPANAKISDTIGFYEIDEHDPNARIGRILTPPPKDSKGRRILDLTLMMGPSAHSGEEDRFAATNVYNTRVIWAKNTKDLARGQILEMRGIQRTKPIEYATAWDISFELKTGVTRIEAWPDGSTGTAGYFNGRVIDLHYK